MEEEYSWKKIRYLLHNTSKDQRGPVRISSAASRHQMKHIFTTRSSNSEQHVYIYKGNEPDYPCTLHHSPWPFSCPCLPLFWLKMGTQLVLDHKNILYTAFVIALGSLFKWKNGILGIY